MSIMGFSGRNYAFWMLFLGLGFIMGFLATRSGNGEMVKVLDAPKERVEGSLEFGISTSDYTMNSGKIKSGDFFSTLMGNFGLSESDIYVLSKKSKGVFDLRQLRVGYTYHSFHTRGDSIRLAYLVYERDRESYVVFDLLDSLSVVVYDKEYDVSLEYADVTINSSLWLDVTSAGVTPLLALELAEVYAWTIDFFGLQKGDSFRTLYQVKSYKGEVVEVSKILYANFLHMNNAYRAFYFREDGSDNMYWSEDGGSLRKTFLKSPLNFSRVSSGFSYARRHPITRRLRPHTGVDYAAPTGTPVWSIGDGLVVEKKYTRAGGRQVTIRHNSVYSSAYLHLSRYGRGISVGRRVSQKEIIGYVGSTGYSTGPHLDFRIWKYGTPINPLRMKSPPALPVKKKNMEDFELAKADALLSRDRFLAAFALDEKISLL